MEEEYRIIDDINNAYKQQELNVLENDLSIICFSICVEIRESRMFPPALVVFGKQLSKYLLTYLFSK